MMNRVCMNRMIGFVLIWITSVCTGAETRTWTLEDGSSLEAEYVIVMGGKVNLKLPAGKIIKLPLNQLIPEDRIHIELENPPVFRIDFVRNRDQEVFDLMPGQGNLLLRPPEYRCHYGVKIKQRDTYAYKHALRMEFFAIGKERAGAGLILIDHQDTASFLLTKENNWSYKFLSEREVVLQNNHQISDTMIYGRKYHGYLILLRDVRDKIIAVETSHDFLYENLENLAERGIGNYMDKTCTRIFPTRPKNPFLGL